MSQYDPLQRRTRLSNTFLPCIAVACERYVYVYMYVWCSICTCRYVARYVYATATYLRVVIPKSRMLLTANTASQCYRQQWTQIWPQSMKGKRPWEKVKGYITRPFPLLPSGSMKVPGHQLWLALISVHMHPFTESIDYIAPYVEYLGVKIFLSVLIKCMGLLLFGQTCEGYCMDMLLGMKWPLA